MTKPTLKPMLVTRIYVGAAAAERLPQLAPGLTAERLYVIVERGENARMEATDHDPVTAEGYDAYRYRVRAIRDVLCPLGWSISRQGGLEGTTSPCGRLRITTRAGTDAVGDEKKFPQPKRPVGNSSKGAIEANDTLLFDPSWLNVGNANGANTNDSDIAMWMLLVARVGDMVNLELSLPSGINDDGLVADWIERNILTAIDLSGPMVKSEAPVVNDPNPVRRAR